MNAIYIGVILVFVLLMFRNRIMPYIRSREKQKKLPEAACAREVNYPRYKVFAFNLDDYCRADVLSIDVEYELNKICGELAYRGFDLSGQIEAVSVRNLLLVFIRYPNNRIFYPPDLDVQKEGEKK